MNTITIKASRDYQVLIGSGIMNELGSRASLIQKPCKAAIISDSNVWPIYGSCVKRSLEQSGYETCNFLFSAGEESKNGTTYLSVLDFLAQNHITRSDILIALGGGVVGDLVGFAASTYLRGISYIQVPTTLLAMVDSSVGGKTAIDLPSGKNLAGSFYQPSLVLCDIDALNTLPENYFRDGSAEVIKYGVLYDEILFAHLEKWGLSFDREYVVSRCVSLKRDVVSKDEFDTGARQKLNLGHTIGHGIEASSNFTVSHGTAVAIGMAVITRAGEHMGICDLDTRVRIEALLKKFCLLTAFSQSAESLCQYALSDKKRSGDSVNLIIPERIGRCRIQPTPVTELKSLIEIGL